MANSARNLPGTDAAEPRVVRNVEIDPMEKVTEVYENNKKRISTTVTIILVVVAGYFAYTKLYKGPAEEKAASAMYYPTLYFSADSLQLAMNGGGDSKNMGFVKIAKKYDGTAAGNLAHYYCGVCYLKTGDYKSSVTEFKKFDGKGTMVGNMAAGMAGEAYMELGDKAQAIDNFKKAISDKNDGMVTPMFLYQLGMAYESDNKNADAIAAFKRIRDEYPRSLQARDMDKELARLGELN